jgi:hypothetical protein
MTTFPNRVVETLANRPDLIGLQMEQHGIQVAELEESIRRMTRRAEHAEHQVGILNERLAATEEAVAEVEIPKLARILGNLDGIVINRKSLGWLIEHGHAKEVATAVFEALQGHGRLRLECPNCESWEHEICTNENRATEDEHIEKVALFIAEVNR